MMQALPLLKSLHRAAQDGALRRLDAAFARGLHEIDPGADPRVLLAAALVAHADGQGHVCLPLPGQGPVAAALGAWLAPALRPQLSTWLDACGWAHAPRSALSALAASPLVHRVDSGTAAAGSSRPLVLEGGRLYLRRHWQDECALAAALRQRARVQHPVDTPRVRVLLAELFPPDAGAATGLDAQAAACALAMRSVVSVVTGGPGTGKTHTAARLLVLASVLDGSDTPLRFALAAPTGKAAARLRQSIAAALESIAGQGRALAPQAAALAARLPPARTLHALLGARPDTRQLRYGPRHPLPVDLLLLDEASMVHLDGMTRLVQALAPATRLVLLGDKDQLASVEAGAVMAELCAQALPGPADADSAAYLQACLGLAAAPQPSGARAQEPPAHALARHTSVLTRSLRFQGAIAALASAAHRGDAGEAEALLRDGAAGVLQWAAPARTEDLLHLVLHGTLAPAGPLPGPPSPAGGYAQALAGWRGAAVDPGAQAPAGALDDATLLALLREFDRFRVLCAVREGAWGVQALNASIEGALAGAGLIRPGCTWYPGRPVMVMRNESAAGVFNGDIGIVLPPAAPGAAVRVAFAEGGTVRRVAASRLPEVQTAFAMTVHKAQGSEFSHTVLVLPPEVSAVLRRELVYTGITRARERFTLLTPRPSVLAQALAQRSTRASGLAERLCDPAS